jgi:hypothetical protein
VPKEEVTVPADLAQPGGLRAPSGAPYASIMVPDRRVGPFTRLNPACPFGLPAPVGAGQAHQPVMVPKRNG